MFTYIKSRDELTQELVELAECETPLCSGECLDCDYAYYLRNGELQK